MIPVLAEIIIVEPTPSFTTASLQKAIKMSTEELRERLHDYQMQRGNRPLYDFFVETLLPEYEQNVDRWVWANDRVLDLRPLWVQRESTAPELAGVLTLTPLEKAYKWHYGLDKDGRVLVARQENENDSDLSLWKYEEGRAEGVHYCSYDMNSIHYIQVSECIREDGKIISHMLLSGHEVDSEEYEYDTAGRVVRITRERNFITPEAERERANKLRLDLEHINQRRVDMGLHTGPMPTPKVVPAKPDVIVLEYAASYDDKGCSQIQLHSEGVDRVVYQRK